MAESSDQSQNEMSQIYKVLEDLGATNLNTFDKLKVDPEKLTKAMPDIRKFMQMSGSLVESKEKTKELAGDVRTTIKEQTETKKEMESGEQIEIRRSDRRTKTKLKNIVRSEKRKFLVIDHHVHVIKEFGLDDEIEFQCESKHLSVKIKLTNKNSNETDEVIVTLVYMQQSDSELLVDQEYYKAGTCPYVKK
jgi:hypothetical protein